MPEPREIQRLERMKQNANKYMDLIERHPTHENVKRWQKRLQDMLAGIELTELEAAAVILKSKQATGGVHIEVPAHQFKLKSTTPSMAEEVN